MCIIIVTYTYLNNQQVFKVYEKHIIAFVLSYNDENKIWL